MGRKVVGLGAAVVLALAGTLALFTYVRSAADRARSGEEEVQVLVALAPIAAGTPTENLSGLVELRSIPAKVVPEGAIATLDPVQGLVTSTDIIPDEEILISRFAAAANFSERGAGVEVPPDMLELTIQLAPQRVIGGILSPGQRVAVIATFSSVDGTPEVAIDEDGNVVPLPSDGPQGGVTEILLHNVLVTAIQEEAQFATPQDRTAARLTTPPEGSIGVTVALRPFDAERLVFLQEFGSTWLALERETVPTGKDSRKSSENIFDDEAAG